MTILEICKAIEAHTRGSDIEIGRDWILSQLNVRAQSCPELWCDGNIRFDGRPEPLSGAEVLDAPFLLFDYDAHYPRMILREMEDLEAIQAAILSGGGILNIFTDWMLPFADGQLRPYELSYDPREVAGPEILGRQETTIEYFNKSLKWLPIDQQTRIMENKQVLPDSSSDLKFQGMTFYDLLQRAEAPNRE